MPEPTEPTAASELSLELEAWSRAHAVRLILGCTAVALAGSTLPLVAIGLASYLALFWRTRGHFTASSGFGAANAVTLLRLVLVLALGLGAPDPLPLSLSALLAGFILVLDGVDGWLARKTKSASTFGAHFDMETDALFVLMMALVLWTSGRLGLWLSCGGLLRPLYVIWLWLFPAPHAEEPRSNWGRWAFLAFAIGLVAALASTSAWADVLAVFGTVAVTLSFGRSGRYWYRARVQARSSAGSGDSSTLPGN